MTLTEAFDPFDVAHMQGVRSSRRRGLDRLKSLVISGHHMPTADELLSGMPFLKDSISEDMAAFAAELAGRVPADAARSLPPYLVASVQAFRDGPSAAAVHALDTAFACANELGWPTDARECRLRCRIYLAHLGDRDAAVSVGYDALCAAYSQDWHLEGRPDELVWQAIGWMGLCTTWVDFEFLGPGKPIPTLESNGLRVASIADEFRVRVGRAVLETELMDRESASRTHPQVR